MCQRSDLKRKDSEFPGPARRVRSKMAQPTSNASVAPAAPELGWRRRSKESEMNWFARVKQHEDGSKKRMRDEYHKQWRDLDEQGRNKFRKEMDSLARTPVVKPAAVTSVAEAPAVPWLHDDGSDRWVQLPEGYSVSKLREDFAAFAENPSKHDQKRHRNVRPTTVPD